MSYSTPVYTLEPGQRVTIQKVGREIAVLEASDSFLIAVDSGEPEYIHGGLQLRAKQPFSDIVLRNPQAGPVTVRLGITDGEIKDNRLSVTAPIEVSRIGDPIEVSGFSTMPLVDLGGSSATRLYAMHEGLREAANYMHWHVAPKHKLGGSSFVINSVVATQMVVNPSLNTNGVIVRSAGIVATSGAVGLFVNGATPGGYGVGTPVLNTWSPGANGMPAALPGPLILPAGQGLYAVPTGGNFSVQANWDYL